MTDSPHPTAETVDGHHRLDTPVAIRPAPIDARRPWRWTTGTIAVAALTLAAVNAPAVGGWFDELTPGPLSEPLRAPIAGWTAATDRLGLDVPRAWLRRRWTAAQDLRFGKEQPGQKGAAAGREAQR